jgi:hypothetical protein
MRKERKEDLLTVFARFDDVSGCSFREQGGEQVVVGAVAVEQGCERDGGGRVAVGRQEQVAGGEDKVGLCVRVRESRGVS